MGSVISFTRVTPEQLHKAEEDPEWAEELLWELAETESEAEDSLDGYLDKAWGGIEFLLGKEGDFVEFLMDGSPIDEEGTLFSWNVEQVNALAKKLREVSFENLKRHYDVAEMNKDDVYPGDWTEADRESELEYLGDYYRRLVAYFDAAAQAESPLIMEFSF